MKLDDIQKFLVALEDCDLSDELNLIQQVKQLNDIRWFFCNDQCITNIQFAGITGYLNLVFCLLRQSILLAYAIFM